MSLPIQRLLGLFAASTLALQASASVAQDQPINLLCTVTAGEKLHDVFNARQKYLRIVDNQIMVWQNGHWTLNRCHNPNLVEGFCNIGETEIRAFASWKGVMAHEELFQLSRVDGKFLHSMIMYTPYAPYKEERINTGICEKSDGPPDEKPAEKPITKF